jgi:hypothetical protein
MAVVLITHVPSREAYEQVADNQAPPGCIIHTASEVGDGVRVVDVWESRQAIDTFFETQLGPRFAISARSRHSRSCSTPSTSSAALRSAADARAGTGAIDPTLLVSWTSEHPRNGRAHARSGRPGATGAAVLDTSAFAGAKRASAEQVPRRLRRQPHSY